jgi:molybdopterin-dependent oxidoreductase alpha subunit
MLGLGTKLADMHLPIRVNGDLALFQEVNRRLLADDAIDHAFLSESCEGLEELRAHLGGLDPDVVAHATGLGAQEIDAFVALCERSERTIVCWAMGLTQHRNAVATIREIMNFLLLRGSIGKPGAGACPVRGHSNVQGDRTMGIFERPTEAFLDRMQETLGFPMPREHGVDVVDAIRAMRDGHAHVFMAMGGNFLSATPDTEVTAAALRNCRLTVHVATKPNRSHVVCGREALILPTLGRTERDLRGGVEQRVTVEDSMSAVHASRGRLHPASAELRSEVAIVCELAQRVLGDKVPVRWPALADDYGAIRDLIEQAIPGFENFNARLADGFVLPHPPRDGRVFKTPSGRARLTANDLDVIEVPEGSALLQTIRSHDQFNTTIYGLNDRYRGIRAGRRVVLVSPDDLQALGVADGQTVDVVGPGGRRAERFRVVAYPTARGCVAGYFPELNALVPLDSVALESGTPASKSVVVRLVPHDASGPAQAGDEESVGSVAIRQ